VAFAGLVIFLVVFGTGLLDHIARDDKSPLSDSEHIQFVFKSLGTALLTVYLPTFIAGVVVLIFYVTDGTPRANRFGSDPKGRGEPMPSAPMSLADVPEEMH
jgi:uncharacterized membrane protein YhaH (DUF805 family)